MLPAVEERGFRAVEVPEGGGAFGQLDFGEAGGAAFEDAGVGFDVFRAADDASQIGGLGCGAAVKVEGRIADVGVNWIRPQGR